MRTCLFLAFALVVAVAVSGDDEKEVRYIWISLPKYLHDIDDRLITLSDGHDSAENLGFIRPVVSSEIRTPFGKRMPDSNDIHLGVDVDVPYGTPVKAVAKGMVDVVDFDPMGLGWYLVIYHGNRLYTIYGHLDRIVTKKGDFMEAGTVVAYSGQTGFAIVPCLHFGIVRAISEKGYYIDPSPLFVDTQP